jgi:hypothetical protein
MISFQTHSLPQHLHVCSYQLSKFIVVPDTSLKTAYLHQVSVCLFTIKVGVMSPKLAATLTALLAVSLLNYAHAKVVSKKDSS